LVRADEDTVRDAIPRFNEIGLACLDLSGGRPSPPTELGQPFTRWSIRKLAAYLRRVHGRVIRIGREALRCLLARRGITFQRTKTWKESPDPDTKPAGLPPVTPSGTPRPTTAPTASGCRHKAEEAHAGTPGSPLARIRSTGVVDRHCRQRLPKSTRPTDTRR